MDYGDAAVLRDLRVGVDVIRLAVGRPAGMADAERAGQGSTVIRFCNEVLQTALGLFDLQTAVLFHADAGGIVSAVFQARQTLQQDRSRLLLSYVSNDTTHMKLFLL